MVTTRQQAENGTKKHPSNSKPVSSKHHQSNPKKDPKPASKSGKPRSKNQKDHPEIGNKRNVDAVNEEAEKDDVNHHNDEPPKKRAKEDEHEGSEHPLKDVYQTGNVVNYFPPHE